MKTLLILAVAGGLAGARSFVVDGAQVEVSEQARSFTCRFNALLPSPSSRSMVLWDAPRDLGAPVRSSAPSSILSIDIPEESDRGDEAVGRYVLVTSSMRVEPVRWTRSNEQLLLRVGRSGAAMFDPRTRLLERSDSFGPEWADVRLAVLDHGASDFHRDPRAIAQLRRIAADGGATRLLATVAGEGTTFLAFRPRNNFALTAYSQRRRWETGIPLSFASKPVLPPGRSQPSFMGEQDADKPFLPYALPLVDRSTGRTIGRFGWEKIETGVSEINLSRYFGQLVSIKDASANGGTIFVLLDLEREKRLVRIRGTEIRSWRLCHKGLWLGGRLIPDGSELPDGLGVTRSEVRFAPLGGASDPGAFGFLYRPARSNGELVVHFHGGPTASLAENTISAQVARLAPLGYSVLEVEYSGMLGGGLSLSRRLPRLGMRALREDVSAVARWVSASGYRKAYVLGDSFGGVPTLVAATEHRASFAHFFFRVPLLKLRDPRESVRQPNSAFLGGSVAPKSQLAFENMVFGGSEGRSRFDRELRAMAEGLRPAGDLSFFFADKDPVSSITDLPTAFAGSPSAVVLDDTHESLPSHDEVWTQILSSIARRSDSADGSGRAGAVR